MTTSNGEEQKTCSGLRRKDEPAEEWIQRVVAKPLDGNLDQQMVLDKINDIMRTSKERSQSKRVIAHTQAQLTLVELEQEFYEISSKLLAWATSKPSSMHVQEVKDAEKRVQAARDQLKAQEYICGKLLDVASTIHAAVQEVSRYENDLLDRTEQASWAQELPDSDKGQPKVLAPNSSP
ncbi:hypothetical protein PIIN_05677 [Serendipita indica DSM 11827]|uniref:Uncharacterized protein n=1 Tax=Serendipita indica (strain DSM 11827) TaxID=1109443 RepID=G4TKB1_SERID|nr:hypothetical protein PIIN_05677 [Serendipita indica DSM 11827]